MKTKLDHLPARIAELRVHQGLSQADFAEIAGLTQAQVSAYETGRAFPGLEVTVRMAEAFGTSVQDLLGETRPVCAAPRPPTRVEKAVWILEAMQFSRTVIERIRVVLRDPTP